jgi:hypothetical protein
MRDTSLPPRCSRGLRLQRRYFSIRHEIGPRPKMFVVPEEGLVPCRPAVLPVTAQDTQKIGSYFKCLKIHLPLGIMNLLLFTSLKTSTLF